MRVLITGTSAYIGGPICVELLHIGHDLFTFYNNSSGLP